jgi:alanine racemase
MTMHPPIGKLFRADHGRIRENVEVIARQTGVEVWAVIKADAYGLGARVVGPLVGDLVSGFCFFRLSEAIAADIWNLTHKPSIAVGPPDSDDPEDYLRHHVRPAVASVEQARLLRRADPILAVDTGMHRFACPRDQVGAVLEAGGCREAFTHATRMEHVRQLQDATDGYDLKLHAGATALLHEPAAWLDGVRPGLAMYEDAIRVTTALHEVHASSGPIGYTGFTAPRHGVIVVGYSNGLRPGRCLINGQSRRILEVGMQSAYVEVGPADRAGDEVVLLGEGLRPQDLSPDWGCSPQDVLYRLARM